MASDLEVEGANVPIRTPRLIPHIIDGKAEAAQESPCMYAPRSSDPRDGWEPVTWKVLANAINHAANWLHETIGVPEPDTFPTVTYLGPNDGRYYALLVGAQKAGYKAFFVSPRNTVEGYISLLDNTQCDHVVVAPVFRSVVEDWPALRSSLKIINVPAYETWFNSTTTATPVPYTKTYAQARLDPMVVLHTSGTTGIPKPVVSPHGMICIADQLHDVPDFQGCELTMRTLVKANVQKHLMAMPLFHAAGTYIFLFMAVYWDFPVVLVFPEKPISVQVVYDCLKYSGCDCAVIPPAILAQMSEDDEHIEQLKKIKYACYGGGSLPPEAGNKLVERGVGVMNWIASTECAPYMQFVQRDPKLWQYYIFNSAATGLEFRRVNSADEPKGGEFDVYSMVIKRKSEDPGYQSWFYTFPDKDEFDTKDLFRPHPTLPNHWQHAGRGDDIIVFSNGEKLNPTTIEAMLHDSPLVKGAVVFGAGRFQAGLIVEPLKSQDGLKTEDFIESIWPTVVAANQQTVAHGRIAKDMIMVTREDMPFPRAGKGTIQRAGSVKLYQREIEAMYARGQLPATSTVEVHVDVSSEEALAESIASLLRQTVASTDESAATALETDTNLFSAGVDSLVVINTAKQLRLGLEAAGLKDTTPRKDGINARAFYDHPTPRELAQHILVSFSSTDADSSKAVDSSDASDIADDNAVVEMQVLLEKYITNLPTAPSSSKTSPATTDQTVIVTGTTGLLGSHILATLLPKPIISKIICLNRAPDGGASKLPSSLRSSSSKLEFYHVDTTSPILGLPSETYTSLLQQTDRIIHNAWPVNFNIPLSSFSPSLLGTRHMADFASACSKKPTVVFISSISSVFAYKDGPSVPEERFDDLAIAVPGGGYGQSKMLASLILDKASEKGGFDAAIVRVGQIAGCQRDDDGGLDTVWNRQEWLPSLVASSVYLGALPASLGSMGRVDWVPMESIAGLVCEIAEAGGKGYYHGVNPNVADWGQLLEAVREFYKIPKVVDFGQWVTMLEKSRVEIESTENREEVQRKLELNPGLKLLDTYRRMMVGGEGAQPVLAVTRSLERSEAFRAAQPITPSMMNKWCAQWAFRGQ